jgi:hypothetical protein
MRVLTSTGSSCRKELFAVFEQNMHQEVGTRPQDGDTNRAWGCQTQFIGRAGALRSSSSGWLTPFRQTVHSPAWWPNVAPSGPT